MQHWDCVCYHNLSSFFAVNLPDKCTAARSFVQTALRSSTPAPSYYPNLTCSRPTSLFRVSINKSLHNMNVLANESPSSCSTFGRKAKLKRSGWYLQLWMSIGLLLLDASQQPPRITAQTLPAFCFPPLLRLSLRSSASASFPVETLMRWGHEIASADEANRQRETSRCAWLFLNVLRIEANTFLHGSADEGVQAC